MAGHTPREAYLPVYPGLGLKNGRYTIRRKLGEGVFSATYLVEDAEKETGKYLAAKILTLEGTSRHGTGEIQELQFLKAIQACDDINSLPVLRDDFFVDGPRGRYLCFVMDLLSTDVSSFRRQFPKKALPPFWVKNIIALVLEGLEQLHDLDIIHTDIKPDNILFGGISDERVERLLSAEDIKIEGEINIDGKPWPVLQRQPIPHTFTPDSTRHDAEVVVINLVDLGQGQWAGKQPTVDDFSARSLRAPEVILKSSFGPKLDIWSIGCITFELLVGHWLFHPEDGGDEWRIEDDHLAKMLELTGESFVPAILEHAQLRNEYFDDSGELLRVKREDLYPSSIEQALRNYEILPEDEVQSAAEFIRACIHLDPGARPSARELQLHPWLKDAFAC
ncbi:kinase-like protein [Lanmaoa asiatica]|nr:kinase-like protein [Lanmaoa asiatica]